MNLPQPDRNTHRHGSYKSVYLRYRYSEYQVSEEGYAYIEQLIHQFGVCKNCKQYYDDEQNPKVAGSLCLSCFSRENPSLEYQGPIEPTPLPDRDEAYPPRTYFYLDRAGYVHTTKAGPGNDDRAQEDKRATAHFWNFPLPEEANRNGKQVSVQNLSCTFYGDLRHSQIILANFCRYSPPIDISFLIQKGGPATQLSRRNELHKSILAEAREELEATRLPDGKGFLIDGKECSRITEGDVYRLIAYQMNQELTSTKQSQPEEAQAEPEAEEAPAASTAEQAEPPRQEAPAAQLQPALLAQEPEPEVTELYGSQEAAREPEPQAPQQEPDAEQPEPEVAREPAAHDEPRPPEAEATELPAAY